MKGQETRTSLGHGHRLMILLTMMSAAVISIPQNMNNSLRQAPEILGPVQDTRPLQPKELKINDKVNQMKEIRKQIEVVLLRADQMLAMSERTSEERTWPLLTQNR